MSVFKAAASMRELQQRLTIVLPDATTFTNNVDPADGMPVLTILTGSENESIKIYVDDNAGRVDGLGLAQRAYSPHVCAIIQESADAASTAVTVARTKILAGCAKLGMKVLFTQAQNAGAATTWTAATAAVTADTAHVTVTLPSDEIYPLTMSQ